MTLERIDLLRVVVADDEEDVRLVLAMQLDAVEGITVVGDAADGAEAIDLCRDLRPDAVVMDLLMPNVNGFEAIERLRSEQPDLGIVAYTGVAGEFVRTEMERLGVPLVLKSGDASALVEALRRVTVHD
ncbi:MAG TPA: response regulator transcription factor [Acidimicrobiia bacterium]|nr:response regulator transcription factor [Acidimicrobiia bacterium]